MPQFEIPEFDPDKTIRGGVDPEKGSKAEEAWRKQREALQKRGDAVSLEENPIKTIEDLRKNQDPNKLGMYRALSEEESKRLYNEEMIRQAQERQKTPGRNPNDRLQFISPDDFAQVKALIKKNDEEKAQKELGVIKNLPDKKLSSPPSPESDAVKNTPEKLPHHDQIQQPPQNNQDNKEGFFRKMSDGVKSLFKRNVNPERIPIETGEKKTPEDPARAEIIPIETQKKGSQPEEEPLNENVPAKEEAILSNKVLERIDYFSGKLGERENIIKSLATGASITMKNGEEFPPSSRKEFMEALIQRGKGTQLFSGLKEENPHWVRLSGMLDTVHELIDDIAESSHTCKELALSVSEVLNDEQKWELAKKFMENQTITSIETFQPVLKAFNFSNKKKIAEEYVRAEKLYSSGRIISPGDPFSAYDKEFIGDVIRYLEK